MRSALIALFSLSACAGPTSATPPAPAAPASVAPAAPASKAPAAPASVAPAAPASVAPVAPGPPGELPLLVRKLLDGRMLRHGTDLGALESAVRSADLGAVAVHARNIAEEPRIARPVPGAADDTLNQAIPPTFFDFQDVLHQRAEALAAAAAARDVGQVKTTYEALGQTCGQCHHVWFPMPSD